MLQKCIFYTEEIYVQQCAFMQVYADEWRDCQIPID